MKVALLTALLLSGATSVMAQTVPTTNTVHQTATTIQKRTKSNLFGSESSSTTSIADIARTTPVVAAASATPAAAMLASKTQRASAKQASLPVCSQYAPPVPVVHHSTGRERLLVCRYPPKIIAQMITANLKDHPDGNSPIDPAHCSPNADGCATPNDYVTLIRDRDPDYGITNPNQLAEYFTNNLEGRTVPQDGVKHWQSCLKHTKNGAHASIWDCLARELHPGEIGYYSKKTGKLIMADDCDNVVGEEDVKKIELNCNEIDVYLKPGDKIHRFWMSYTPLPEDKCNALMKAGESEWSQKLLDECPDDCDASRPAHDVGMPANGAPIGFVAQRAGWYKFRETTQVAHLDGDFVFCVIHPDGYETKGKVITKTAYGTYGRAYIVYSPEARLKTEKAEDQVPPPEWHGTVHVWHESGERIPPK